MKILKRIFITLVLQFLILNCIGQDSIQKCDTIYEVKNLEIQPKYGDENNDLLNFCMEHIAPILSENQEQLEEYIFDTYYYFIISSSGEILDVEFLRFGYSDECKRKVKEEFMKMKNWTPGKIHGELVCTRYLFILKICWSN